MNKFDLEQQIIQAYTLFAADISNLAYIDANLCINHKWTINQNLDHINKSLTQLNTYLVLPKSRIAMFFGSSNKTVVSMATFMLKLNQALKYNDKSIALIYPDYNPKNTQQLILEGKKILENTIVALKTWTEDDLDSYHFPHPLLDKILAREVLYFTINHCKHHHKTVKQIILTNGFKTKS